MPVDWKQLAEDRVRCAEWWLDRAKSWELRNCPALAESARKEADEHMTKAEIYLSKVV